MPVMNRIKRPKIFNTMISAVVIVFVLGSGRAFGGEIESGKKSNWLGIEGIIFRSNQFQVRCTDVEAVVKLSDSFKVASLSDTKCTINVPKEIRFEAGKVRAHVSRKYSVIQSASDTTISFILYRDQFKYLQSAQFEKDLNRGLIYMYLTLGVAAGLLVLLISSSGFLFPQ